MLSDQELASLPRERTRRIEVRSFTRAHEIDPILVARSYYLEPAESAIRAYVVLREALQRAGKVAVVTVSLRQREALAGLRVRDGFRRARVVVLPRTGHVAQMERPAAVAAEFRRMLTGNEPLSVPVVWGGTPEGCHTAIMSPLIWRAPCRCPPWSPRPTSSPWTR